MEVIDARDDRSLSVLPFVAVTFGWTWPLWWTAAVFPGISVPLLFLAGGLGPLVGAAWVLRRAGPVYRRRFLRRVWDPRRIRPGWWGVLLGVAVGPALFGTIVADVAGVAATAPDLRPTAVAGVVVFALAAGLVEEPGWRGVASDAWQARVGPVWAALGIGVLWALWHLPLYFVEGSYQEALGFGSVRFWLTNLVLVQLGVLYVWLANGAGASILVVVLAHAGFNVAGELVPRSTTGDVVACLAITAVAVAVVVRTRGDLCRSAGSAHVGSAVA